MIFAKKLCFEDIPYQPAVGEVLLEQTTTGVNGVHAQGQHLYPSGRYKVEISAGLPFANAFAIWDPYGISMVVEMDTPFYIDAYIGGGALSSRTSATTNPYRGTGKAQSNKSGYNGQAQSDGIFGGAGGSGHINGVAWAIGGGNAVGNTPSPGSGDSDAGGSSGSALWFVAKGKGVGSLKADGSPDAYKCFHCGGHGGTANRLTTTAFGAGGGAYGGGGGGSGAGSEYAGESERGGNGAGGYGGGQFNNGYGIGAGKANRQGGLAYYDGEKWIDVFNDMQKGDGLGYNSVVRLRITYLGGSVISDDYIDIMFNVNSSGFADGKGVQYIAIYWPEEGQVGALEPNVFYDISAAGVYNVRAPLVHKGQKVTVVLYGWFSNNQRPNDVTFEQIKYSEFTASEATLEQTINATTRTLTLGLNTGVINGLTNCSDWANNLMTLYYENTGSVSATGSTPTISSVGILSIGSTPTTMPQTVSVQQLGLPNEVLQLKNQMNVQQPLNSDYRLHLITEGFETLLAVEPDDGYTIQENVTSYYWTVTYYLQTDGTAGELGSTVETVDNGLLTDTIETDSTSGLLPEVGVLQKE